MDKKSNDAKWQDTLNDVAINAQKTFDESVKRLAELATRLDAVKLFTAVFANLAFRPAGEIDDYVYGTVPAKLELLAYHIYPFIGDTVKAENITPWDVNECIDLLEKMMISRTHSRIFSPKKTEDRNDIDFLIDHVTMDAEVVRGSAYPEQTMDEITSIQGQFENWFFVKIGIGPKRAIEILKGILRVHEEKFNSFVADCKHNAVVYLERWQNAKKASKKHRANKEDVGLLHMLKNSSAASAFGFFEQLNKIAPNDIPVGRADLSLINLSVTEAEWQALIDLVGLTIYKRKEMRAPIEVRQRPLFVVPDNRALLADLSNCLDVVWDRFEEAAKDDKVFYDKKYQKWKAAWLEEKISIRLSNIFPKECIYYQLDYPDPDKNDASTAELDVAILWEPFLILIEGKAKQFRMESQLGDIGRLRTDIKANVEDAFEQARRALKYILREDNPQFIERSTGRKLAVEKSKFSRFYLITVSLHHLAGLATRLASLKDLSLFRDGEYPISLSIADLEIISQFCQGPDIFLHYAEKRLQIQKLSVQILGDELDFFGAYLKTRLQADRLWNRDKKPLDFISLSGFTSDFDRWIAYKRGEIASPPDLKLEIPSEIDEILVVLRKSVNDRSARWIAFSLLDMSDKSLYALAKGIQEIRTAILTPGKFRRTVFQYGDTVVSLVASLGLSLSELRERTYLRTVFEKYRRKATRSIGIGLMMENPSKPFYCASWLEGPWQQDEALDKAILLEPPFVPIQSQKLPKRNDPCICGSGRKFKKCCLDKIQENRRDS